MKQLLLYSLLLCMLSCSITDANPGAAGEAGTKGEIAAGEQLPKEEYIATISKSQEALTSSQEMGSFRFSATYVPLYLQAILATRSHPGSDSLVKAFTELNKNTQFFTLKISSTSDRHADVLKSIAGVTGDYYKTLDYLSFRIQDDLSLVAGNDTVPCSITHYERAYDVRPEASILLAFDMPGSPGQFHDGLTLSYNDRLLGNGHLNFRFTGESLHALPRLLIK